MNSAKFLRVLPLKAIRVIPGEVIGVVISLINKRYATKFSEI